MKKFIETREGADGSREYLLPFDDFDKVDKLEFEKSEMKTIVYSCANAGDGIFPQEDIILEITKCFSEIKSYDSNVFKSKRDKLYSRKDEKNTSFDRILSRGLKELDREEPLFGATPVVEVCGVTPEGLTTSLTIGQKIILIKLIDMVDSNMDDSTRHSANKLLHNFKKIIMQSFPSVEFNDVTN